MKLHNFIFLPITSFHCKDILLKNEYEALSEEEKQTCRLFYDYEGLPMQGMLQESFNFLKNILT